MERHDSKMGIWMTSALVVGTIIGAGIFMLPVSLAPLGRNALIGWVVSGVGVLCIVYALAQLSKLGGDGIQANVEREFGPTIAFLVADPVRAIAAQLHHPARARRGRDHALRRGAGRQTDPARLSRMDFPTVSWDARLTVVARG